MLKEKATCYGIASTEALSCIIYPREGDPGHLLVIERHVKTTRYNDPFGAPEINCTLTKYASSASPL